MSNKYYAALDIGTNSVILLTAQLKDHNRFELIDEQLRMPRLGEGVAHNGRIKTDAIDRTFDAVADVLGSIEKSMPYGCAVATATSAVREADNKEYFLKNFSQRFGARPYVISGEDEARTTFIGSTSDQHDNLDMLSVDIGGGSTEYGIGHKGRCRWADSLSIGCVSLTERFGLDEVVSGERVANAYEYARGQASLLRGEVERWLTAQPYVLVSGGTGTTYAGYQLMVEPYRYEDIHGCKSSRYDVACAIDVLRRMSVAERAAESGISEERAPVLPAGLLILNAILDELGIEDFSVTCRGLRFGLIVRLYEGDLSPTWRW